MIFPLSGVNKKYTVLTICILTYIMAYLCRLNYSSAVLKIGVALNVDTTALGGIGALFFFAYAIGQLINGFIGDRVSPGKFIMVAVAATGIVNLAMTFAETLWLIALLWTINGYFQSVFWGCCNRILSGCFCEAEHHIVSTGMSLSMVVSYVLSWAVLGKALLHSSWQSYFLLPAITAGIMLLIWFVFAKVEKNRSVSGRQEKPRTLNNGELLQIMNTEHLWLICFACICTGLIKEGIGLWAPVIFLRVLGNEINLSLLLLVSIPLGNLIGVLLTNHFLKRSTCDPYVLLMKLLGALAIFAALSVILWNGVGVIVVLLIAAVSGMALGCNGILLSFIPLSYAAKNIVATLIGIFDFFAYIGAACSAYVLGRFLAEEALVIVPCLWCVVALCGLIIIYFRRRLLAKIRDLA